MSHRDDFLRLLAEPRSRCLQALDRAVFDALRDGDAGALPPLRAEHAALRDLPASLPAEADRAALVALWPSGFPPLPEWFTNPASVGELGPPCVVRCEPLPAAEGGEGEAVPAAEGGEGEAVPLDLQAEILAKRAEKAIGEDALRATGAVPVAVNTDREVSAEDLGL